MVKLRDRLRLLMHHVFGRHVARSFGGVYWPVKNDAVACVYHADWRMYFNARHTRTWGQLFMDVCHEWTHCHFYHLRHNYAFWHRLEEVSARYISKFIKYEALRGRGGEQQNLYNSM